MAFSYMKQANKIDLLQFQYHEKIFLIVRFNINASCSSFLFVRRARVGE
jgi:hypothetical protein